MGNTTNYNLPYLDPRSTPRGNLDKSRMTTLDRLLRWLFALFGNGVLDDDPLNPSWRLETVPGDSSGSKVRVTAGKGHVGWTAAQTAVDTVVSITSTVYPATFWIYAVLNDTTAEKGTVDFKAYTQVVNLPDTHVGLGAVIATLQNNAIVLDPQNTADYGRVDISLFGFIKNYVAQHIHVGGTNNPSPIDLTLHTRGKLPGSFISDLSASDITQGALDPERISPIPHGKLKDVGTLSHAELEATLASLVYERDNRLLNLGLANLLVYGLAERRAGQAVDLHAIDQALYVPGVTPDSFVSWNAGFAADGLVGVAAPFVPDDVPLAAIDKAGKRIVATLGTGLGADSVLYTTAADWALAQGASPDQHDLEILPDVGDGAITVARPLNYRGVASTDLTAWTTAYVFYDRLTKQPAAPPTALDDDYDVERYALLDFPAPQDWTAVDRILAGFTVGAGSEIGSLRMFLLLDSPVSNVNAFVTGSNAPRTIALSKLVEVRAQGQGPGAGLVSTQLLSAFVDPGDGDKLAKVLGLGFEYGTATGWARPEASFSLAVPDADGIPDPRVVLERATLPDLDSSIFVWNATKYAPTARLTIRHDANSDVTQYGALAWVTSSPDGVRVSTRVANDAADLAISTVYAVDPSSPTVDPAANVGSWIDVIIDLKAAADLASAPVFQSVRLDFLSPSAPASRTWESEASTGSFGVEGWAKRRRFENLAATPDSPTGPSALVVADVSGVGAFRYLRGDFLLRDGGAESALQTGSLLYPTPYQAWNGSARLGFESPSDAFALDDGAFLVADTGNDRLVQVDEDGALVRAVQGNSRLCAQNRAWAALTAVFNPRTGQLWIAFSQYTSVKDKGKIALASGADGFALSATGVDVVPFAPNAAGKSATLVVTFSAATLAQIAAWSSPIRVVVGEGSVQNLGSDGGAGSGGAVPGGDAVCGFPAWYGGLFEALGAGDFLGDGACAYSAAAEGIAAPPAAVDGGAFDPTLTDLQGPGRQVGTVTLPVTVGEIVFDALYAPISAQVTSIGDWVVGTQGPDAAVSYGPTSARQYAVDSGTIPLRAGFLGSVWELGGGSLLAACPAPDGDGAVGSLRVYNRAAGNVLVTQATFRGDVVRAMPSSDGLGYWAAVDDRDGGGGGSRLVRVNTSGRVDWVWGVGTLTHPKGLALLDNGSLAVSE